MVLGKLPVLGRPTILITVGQGPTALAVGADGGYFRHFSLIYPFSPLSPSLRETARYRLKYCLKGPKQPTSKIHPSTGNQKNKFGFCEVTDVFQKYVLSTFCQLYESMCVHQPTLYHQTVLRLVGL